MLLLSALLHCSGELCTLRWLNKRNGSLTPALSFLRGGTSYVLCSPPAEPRRTPGTACPACLSACLHPCLAAADILTFSSRTPSRVSRISIINRFPVSLKRLFTTSQHPPPSSTSYRYIHKRFSKHPIITMAEARPASQKIWLISNDNATMEVGKLTLASPSLSSLSIA